MTLFFPVFFFAACLLNTWYRLNLVPEYTYVVGSTHNISDTRFHELLVCTRFVFYFHELNKLREIWAKNTEGSWRSFLCDNGVWNFESERGKRSIFSTRVRDFLGLCNKTNFVIYSSLFLK